MHQDSSGGTKLWHADFRMNLSGTLSLRGSLVMAGHLQWFYALPRVYRTLTPRTVEPLTLHCSRLATAGFASLRERLSANVSNCVACQAFDQAE